jgi:CRISPR-associated protein Csb1
LNAGSVLNAGEEMKLMSDSGPRKITAADALKSESPLVLRARFEPIAGLDRFQPAGFPEVGHVIYKAPRNDGSLEPVCIVDSPASMANHLESVCIRGAHDLELVDDLKGMPYLRCVTGVLEDDGKLKDGKREVVVTSLTEGHRIASSYFLEGERLQSDAPYVPRVRRLYKEAKELKKQAKRLDGDERKKLEKEAELKEKEAKKIADDTLFQSTLIREFGIELPGGPKAHPPAEKWWDVFKTIFRYDPNSLVHGVLFPQWQVRIPRFLTSHLEAFGASRVDRSGVKFDRLGKTTSGQPIFAVDETTASQIRATFILDLALVHSFGRRSGETQLGLTDKQKQFLVALALWKIDRLVRAPFRFRSGCHLRSSALIEGDAEVVLQPDIREAIREAGFPENPITDVYWPREELYREAEVEQEDAEQKDAKADAGEDEDQSEDEGED